MCISYNLDIFFGGSDYSFSIFFLPLSFFLALLLNLPFTLHIFSGYHKKLAVNYGQSLEIGP